jgi:hypothetical protein
MRQIAYPAALGSCCALGAGASPLRAAEWSITPSYSASVDYDNNRRLLTDNKGSDAGVLTADMLFKHALEDVSFSLEPRYAFRRYSDSSLGNGDDRSIYGAFKWDRETSSLNLTASYWDQSTLVTELLETGIVSGNTHKRLGQAGATGTWGQTELRSLIAQLNYMDVKYHGESAHLLPGYRYPSGTIGERFVLNERGSFTVSAYGSLLESDTKGNSSHSVGLQAEVIYSFSERTNLDASLGESSRVLAGASSHGTDAAISLIHSMVLGQASLSYTRSLVPYGFGFLVERQQVTAAITRPLTPTLSSTLTFFRIQNNETAVLLHLDRRSYDSLALSLNWRPAETWSLGGQIEGIRTQLPDLSGDGVKAWRCSLSMTWTPFPKSRSW